MAKTGYADYQRVDFASGEIVLAVNQAITTSTNFQAENLTSWAFINVTIFTPNGGDDYRFLIQFFQDAAETILIQDEPIHSIPNGSGTVCIAVLSPYMMLTIVPKAGGNATVIQFTAYGSNTYCPPRSLHCTNLPILSLFNGIGISAVDNFGLGLLIGCEAKLDFTTSTANPVTVEVQYWDGIIGVYQTYIHYDNVSQTAPIHDRIGLPDTPINIKVTNGAVAAQNLLGSLQLIG